MANLFHTSLLGYSKKSVNDYLSKLNEEFSQKILEKEQEHKKELQALRAEMERLATENEHLQAIQQEVADALISAKDYAAVLKRQADTDDQEQRAINAARQQAEFRRIQAAADHISDLQREFRSALERMDRELASYTMECRRLQADVAGQDGGAESERGQDEGTPCSSKAG